MFLERMYKVTQPLHKHTLLLMARFQLCLTVFQGRIESPRPISRSIMEVFLFLFFFTHHKLIDYQHAIKMAEELDMHVLFFLGLRHAIMLCQFGIKSLQMYAVS